MTTSAQFVSLSVIERVRRRVVLSPDGCWIWQGTSNQKGYGQMSVNGKLYVVHRLVAEETFGPIPVGSYVRRRCEVRTCVNPEHLYFAPTHYSRPAKTNSECQCCTDRLPTVEAERDAMERMHRHHVAVALDAIAKLNHAQAILAALREPSEAVMKAAVLHYSGDLQDAIRAAVAAAEKGVGACDTP